MSCNSVRCRNRGSGYVKEEAPTTASTEMNARLSAMAAERAAQDARLFPALGLPLPSTKAVVPALQSIPTHATSKPTARTVSQNATHPSLQS